MLTVEHERRGMEMLIERRGYIEIWYFASEYFVFGVMLNGDARICPSLCMAREVAYGS